MASEEKRERVEMVVRLLVSMAERRPVVVTVRDRKQTKREGVCVRQALDGRSVGKLADGDSNVVATIRTAKGVEHVIPVERMSKVALR